MTIPSVSFASPLRSLLLAGCVALASLALLGCERKQVSVGELPCAEEEHVLCASHERELLQPLVTHVEPAGEQSASIEWEYPFPDCVTTPCDERSHEYLVHEDGEVTLAAVRDGGDGRDLWVAWLDSAGQPVFETGVAGSSAWLGTDLITRLTLRRDARGDVLLLVGRGRGNNAEEARGSLRAYAIARSGAIAQSFEIDTSKSWPGMVELLDSDVVIARSPFAASIELARYPRHGDMRWRQTQVARLPDQQEIGLSVDADTHIELLDLTVDRRGRIWGALYEGVVGLVQLDPDGLVGWHVLVLAGFGNDVPTSPMTLAIDSRDRPIMGFDQTVLRFEPDGTDEERSMPRGSAGMQEQFYPQTVQGLDVDEQDRIHVATQDGPFSQHRLLIERISEDFSQRERFVLPLTGERSAQYVLTGLQLTAGGDAYVRILGEPAGSTPEGLAVGFMSARIARVHLDE